MALADRPPVPVRQPRRLPPEVERRIVAAREHTNAGPPVVASLLGLPDSTVRKVLRRHGRSRLPRPIRGPVRRYERKRPESCSTSTSRSLADSGRSASASSGPRSATAAARAGWQYLHIAIDDHSRLAYAELHTSESPAACAAFLHRGHGWYQEQGIRVERVLSDNGNGYRSRLWQESCAELRIARRYTRPRRPQTNGKAEALIKTLQREWAYCFAYHASAHRARALPGYLRWYNRHRPHSSLGGQPPISRVSQVCGSHR